MVLPVVVVFAKVRPLARSPGQQALQRQPVV